MKYLLIPALLLSAAIGSSQNPLDYPEPSPQLRSDSSLSRYSEQEVVTIGDTYIYLRMTMRPLDGIVYRNWMHGGLLSECAYRSGLLYGACKKWYKSGQLKQEGSYINGEKDGVWREWHQNGQLSTEEIYTNGRKNGKCRLWFDNGELWDEETYENGKLVPTITE